MEQSNYKSAANRRSTLEMETIDWMVMEPVALFLINVTAFIHSKLENSAFQLLPGSNTIWLGATTNRKVDTISHLVAG